MRLVWSGREDWSRRYTGIRERAGPCPTRGRRWVILAVARNERVVLRMSPGALRGRVGAAPGVQSLRGRSVPLREVPWMSASSVVSVFGSRQLETWKRELFFRRLTGLRGPPPGGRSEAAPTGGRGVAPAMSCEAQSASWKSFSVQTDPKMAKPGTTQPARARTSNRARRPLAASGDWNRNGRQVSRRLGSDAPPRADLGLGRSAPRPKRSAPIPASGGTPIAAARATGRPSRRGSFSRRVIMLAFPHMKPDRTYLSLLRAGVAQVAESLLPN